MLKTISSFLLKPSAKYSLLSILLVGIVVGSGIFITSAVMLESTASVEFCLSCHVMQKAYDEYSQTIHASNRTGIIATCAECHLPPDYPKKLFVKASRITEVWGYITGVIGTPEKYEQNRLSMAQAVWDELKGDQSAPCRGCHDFSKMASQSQKEHAVKAHKRAQRTNTTCIVCHQGIAHNLPKQPLPEKARPSAPGQPVNCQGCHEDLQNVLAEDHPRIEKGTLQKCTQCHIPGTKPADESNNFYTYMHRSHGKRIECTGCHEFTESGMKLLVNKANDSQKDKGKESQ